MSIRVMQPLKIIGLTAALFLVRNCLVWSQAIKPQPRYLHVMAYDEQKKEILMFGGIGANGIFSDLWALSDTGWSKLSDGGPVKRTKAAFAYDANRKVIVLFGGSGSKNELLSDTWEWNGQKWIERFIKGPSSRNHSMAVYDRHNKSVLLFGGGGPDGLLSDTWTFDGVSWKQVNSNGPRDCLPHGMFFNEESEKVILLTLSVIRDPGDDAHAKNDMWEWTGESWKKCANGTSVVTSSNLQTLSSFNRSEIILFDGDDGLNSKGKTWYFSKGNWRSVILVGPTPRIGAAMAFDKSRNKGVLFGGGDRKNVFNDLWEWDGAKWTELK